MRTRLLMLGLVAALPLAAQETAETEKGAQAKTFTGFAANFSGRVRGETGGTDPALLGQSTGAGAGVRGEGSAGQFGELGVANGGVYGFGTSRVPAMRAFNNAGGLAGQFDGPVEMNGPASAQSLNVTGGAGSLTCTDCIGPDTIAAGAVGTLQIVNKAVTSEKISNGAVGTEAVADGSISSIDIADLSIASADIAPKAVTGFKLALDAVTSSRVADGSLTGADIADKSLSFADIQGVGTEITGVPYTINQPGYYFLAGNLTMTSSDVAITIDASDVTLDLRGFVLDGDLIGANAIEINAAQNVLVLNGTIRDFNGSGIFGTGTHDDYHFRDLRILNNGGAGITVGDSASDSVERCLLRGNGNTGIILNGGVVRNTVVVNNGVHGISVSSSIYHVAVVDSLVSGNGMHGIAGAARLVVRNTVTLNGAIGINTGGIVRDNNVSSNALNGIDSSGQVIGNTVSSNNTSNDIDAAGIRAVGSAVVRENHVRNNNRANIRTAAISSPVIEGNWLSGSDIGLKLESSDAYFADNRAHDNTTDYDNSGGSTDGGGNVSY